MNDALPKISVVVCTYNRSALLSDALGSLTALETDGRFSYEIVVVDDASTDDTANVVRCVQRTRDDLVRYVSGSGSGIAAARNTGVDAGRGQWLAFFDDDQIAERDWLCQLWRVHVETRAECVGGSRSLELSPEELSRLSPITRGILGEIPKESGPRACKRYDLLCTGNLLLSRAVYDLAGGFDPSLVRGGEDTDLFIRIRRAGAACWYAPDAVVRHVIPSYRTEAPYLRWAAERGGACYAERDHREWGPVRVTALALVRVVHAAFIHGFWFAQARLRGNRGEAIGRMCQIHRAWAYARHAFQLARRGKANGEDNHASTEFRRERKLFQNS